MNYLIYIEHAAENLQFWLWYRNYAERFAELPANERNLAPEWTVEQAEAEALAIQNSAPTGAKNISSETAAIFEGTDFTRQKTGTGNPFNTPPRTPTNENRDVLFTEKGWSGNDTTSESVENSFHKKAAVAFQGADLKWQPCKFIFVTLIRV